MIVVLMYHRINDALEPGEWVVPVARFREQMSYLRNHSQVITLGDSLKGHQSPVTSHQKRHILVTLDDGYRDNYQNAFPVLKELGISATVFLTTGYVGTTRKRERYKDVPWERDYLDLEEVREMAMAGVSFGAHTATHPRLLELDIEEAENEIFSSVDFVRKELGVKQPAFSYPYGKFDDSIKRIVKEAGCSCAFTVAPGIFKDGDDVFEIPRIGVDGTDNLETFVKKIESRE